MNGMNPTSGSLSQAPSLWDSKGFVPTGVDAQQVIIQSRPFDEIPSGPRTRPLSVYVSLDMERFIAELGTQHGVSRSTAAYGLICEGLKARMMQPSLGSDPNQEYQFYLRKLKVEKRQRVRKELEIMWDSRDDWEPAEIEATEKDCQALATKHGLQWPPVIEVQGRPIDLGIRYIWSHFDMLLKLKENTEETRVTLREIQHKAHVKTSKETQEAMDKYPGIQSETSERGRVWYWL
jgi:hypothetical protein